jgi:ribonuclease BN (tRNA processing enzyme)
VRIRYQTSALVPPPFALAIELLLEITNQRLKYDFELTYLDRDQISEEEIIEEGFSLEDHVVLKGAFEKVWVDDIRALISKTEPTYPDELEDSQEYWEIKIDNDGFYPKNAAHWSEFLEEFHQAILEQNGKERPLEIEIKRVSEQGSATFEFNARFSKKEFVLIKNGSQKIDIKWENLSNFVKDVYSGDLVYEQASEKQPRHPGLFVNYGDGLWYELGQSLLIKPSKITKWIENR